MTTDLLFDMLDVHLNGSRSFVSSTALLEDLVATGEFRMDGDTSLLARLRDCRDDFDLGFEIALA